MSASKEVLVCQRRRQRAIDQALVEAAFDAHEREVRRLLGAGADVRLARGFSFESALYAAAQAGRLDCESLLGRCKAQGAALFPPSLLAPHTRVAKLLLERGAEPSQTGPFGLTALHQAAASANAELCELLVHAGARIDAVALDGYTALCLAATFARQSACEALMGLGARAHLLARGATPAGMARRIGHLELGSRMRAMAQSASAAAAVDSVMAGRPGFLACRR